MLASFREYTSKGKLCSPDFTQCSTENVCPFTLESVEGCSTRNSIDENEMCFYTLEPCTFPENGKLKK
jgi:hypothetical protein